MALSRASLMAVDARQCIYCARRFARMRGCGDLLQPHAGMRRTCCESVAALLQSFGARKIAVIRRLGFVNCAR